MSWSKIRVLKQKLKAYKAAGISTANGGLFTELTLKQGTYDAMLAEMVEVGFDAVEVSENLVPLTAKAKTEAVRHARENCGLTVLGEVGRKEGEMTDDEIMQDVETYLNAGAQRLDWKGAFLLCLWILSLFIGVTNLPEFYAFILLLISGALVFLFMRHSKQVKFPIVNLKLVWQNHKLSRSLSAAILMYAASYGLIFLMGLYLQYNRGYSPTDAGKFLMIQALFMAVIAPVAGRLSDRYPANQIAGFGCISVVLSFALMLFLDGDSHVAIMVPC